MSQTLHQTKLRAPDAAGTPAYLILDLPWRFAAFTQRPLVGVGVRVRGETMQYSITGDNLQFVHVEVQPGEMVWAEAGAMIYMSGNTTMYARARGGVLSGLKRVVTGESFFITEFTTEGGPGVVAFAGRVPGKIAAIDLRGGKQWIFQKDAFLCAENEVQMDIAFQKRLGAVFFGGEGLILQRYWGEGTLWIHAPGDLTEFTLAAGQTLKISSGHVVGWEASVAYDIRSE